MVSLTDTSYEGLGKFSVAFDFKWHLLSADVRSARIPMLVAEPERYALRPPGHLRINVLEFLAMFIKPWIAIKILMREPTPPGGWIVKLLADITSALGWTTHASRYRRDIIKH